MAAFLPDDLRQTAAAQDGLVTRAQCLEAGLTPSAVSRLASGGRGQRVLPGVLALTTGRLSRRQQAVAVLLLTGRGAQVTGVTSLELLGFRYSPRDPAVHVLLPAERRAASPGSVVVHRTRRLPEPHWVDGLPVTPAPRAAVDACRSLGSVRDAVVLLSEAVQRRTCTVEMLQVEVEAGPSAGSAVLRRAVRALRWGAHSGPEYDLFLLLKRSGLLPPPQVNVPVALGSRTVVPDLCWPEARLVVEVDSAEHHALGTDLEHTARRRAALVAAGWTVLSVSPQRIRDDPDGVLRDIEAAYLHGVRRAG
jgi:very-short-patch-repair endonuclease